MPRFIKLEWVFIYSFSFPEQTKLITVIQHTFYIKPQQAFLVEWTAFESGYRRVMLGK